MQVTTYQLGGKWYFEIVDPSDTFNGYPELIYSDSKGYARESTAFRNGEKWIETHPESSWRKV